MLRLSRTRSRPNDFRSDNGRMQSSYRFRLPRVESLAALLLLGLIASLLAAALHGQPRLHRNGVEYRTIAGEPLLLDASIPMAATNMPAVVVVHGGGWEAGDRRTYVSPLLQLLEESPYAWFSIDYRLAPAHPFPAALEDVEAGIAFVRQNAREFGIDPSLLVLAGESSGGHLVSLAGARDNGLLAGVVSFYGIHNFETWWNQRGGIPRNSGQFLQVVNRDADALRRAREASPTTFVHARMAPFLLIHGDRDNGVPLPQSQEMCQKMREAGARCELHVEAGAGHGIENWETDPRFHTWKPRLRAWLQTLFPQRIPASAR